MSAHLGLDGPPGIGGLCNVALSALLSMTLACAADSEGEQSGSASAGEVESGEVESGEAESGGNSAMTSLVFLNFDGGDFNLGSPDATTNTTDNEVIGGSSLGPYGVGPSRTEVLAAVQADFAPYGISIVDTRPAGDSYSMVVVTSDNPFGSFIDSVSSVDCGDQHGEDLAFAFAQLELTSEQMGALVSRQVGHMLGLEAVIEGQGDVMQLVYEAADPAFTDSCLGLTLELQCGGQHAEYCASGQNAHQELLAHLP